jgi:hypothetical protein
MLVEYKSLSWLMNPTLGIAFLDDDFATWDDLDAQMVSGLNNVSIICLTDDNIM